MQCQICGSDNVDVQVYQENVGSTTVTKTKSKYKEKGHGCLWWLCIGWWWWMIDLFLWIFLFPIKFLQKLFKKKKYVGKSTEISHTENNINYKTIYICKDCGHSWEK